MNRRELRKVDMNLMVCFEALMQERSVTRVGKRLCLGQPTISSALNRLRAAFDDPLFVRVGRKMEPTARATEIMRHLTPGLDAMSKAINCLDEFNPETSDRTFQIGLTDDVEFSLLPDLLAYIRKEAPEAILVFQHTDYGRLAEQLINGEIALAICQTRALPANAKRRALRKVSYSSLRGAGGDLPLSLDEYCLRPHVVVSQSASTSTQLDKYLALLHRKRKVALSVPRYSSLYSVLKNSDLIATVPDFVAETMVSLFGLRADPVPFEMPTGVLSLVWMSHTDNDSAERWMRRKVSQYMDVTGTVAGLLLPEIIQ